MNTKKNIVKRITALGLILLLLLAAFLGRLLFLEHQKNTLIQKAAEGRADLGVVVFGDSIWDLSRGDNGIADLVQEGMGQNIRLYNLSIRGTRATEDETAEPSGTNLMDVLDMVEDHTNTIPKTYEASAELDALYADTPFIRYAIIAYGLNDYFLGVRMENPLNGFDLETYGGALRRAIERVYGLFPGVTIILMGPTYCVGYQNGGIVSESDTFSYGGGTVPQYDQVAAKVAAQYGILFVDNYADLGIKKSNSAKYLADGTHLTLEGREKYADNLLYRLAEFEQ